MAIMADTCSAIEEEIGLLAGLAERRAEDYVVAARQADAGDKYYRGALAGRADEAAWLAGKLRQILAKARGESR